MVSGYHYSRSTAPGGRFNFILEVNGVLSQLAAVIHAAAFWFLSLFCISPSGAATVYGWSM